MANEVEVPVAKNVEEGLKYGVTATGRQLGIVSAKTHGLFKIQFIDGKPGTLPERLHGRYTGTRNAKLDLDNFIRETWKIADEHAKKSRGKKAEQTEVAA
jgi:hypothetical protein